MEIQERRRFHNDGGAQDTFAADEQSAQTGDEAIPATQIGRALTAAIQDQKLMPDQDGFGDKGAEPAGLRQPHQSDDQMKQKNEAVAHPDNRNKTS